MRKTKPTKKRAAKSKKSVQKKPREPITSTIGIIHFAENGRDTRIFINERDLVSAGFSERASSEIFAAAGSCMIQRQGNNTWCRNINCTGSCHLYEITRNPDGSYDEKDLGDEYDSKDNPYRRKPGCFYTCRCE